MTKSIVTVQISETIAPLLGPTRWKLAIFVNKTPRQCAAFLRRKGNDHAFVLPIMVVKTDADIISWRRARHMRVFRPFAVSAEDQIKAVAEAVTRCLTDAPRYWGQRHPDEVEITCDESGTFEAGTVVSGLGSDITFDGTDYICPKVRPFFPIPSAEC